MLLGRHGAGRLRARLFHFWFLMSRPMTLGVRGVVYDAEARAVYLIRHTYDPGWQLPGGGVETGETVLDALERELREEANVELTAPPRLQSFHFNRQASRRDHVALFLITAFQCTGAKQPDMEIAEGAFFAVDRLPEGTTPATRRRLAEVIDEAHPAPDW